jgi:hypothetical protein
MNNILITADYNSTGIKLNDKWTSPRDVELNDSIWKEISNFVIFGKNQI